MNEKRFCMVCGRSITAAKCEECGAIQKEWTFLKQLEHQDEEEIRLQCPFIKDVKSWTRCDGEFLIYTSALKQTIGVSGNGPYGHLLAGRDDLGGRCNKCGKYAYGTSLIQANKEKLAMKVK